MIEQIKKKLQQKCPKLSVPALYTEKLLYVIQEIILEDRLETGHYTKEQYSLECFRLGIGMKPPPKPPKPPLGRRIREGDTRKKCPECNSTQKWGGFLWLQPKGCINRPCKKYWKL